MEVTENPWTPFEVAQKKKITDIDYLIEFVVTVLHKGLRFPELLAVNEG